MKRFAGLLVALLAGCATTSGLEPTVARSGFDNARVVNIAPHGTSCRAAGCTSLGAQWRSSAPDQALLVVGLYEIRAITGAQLNVDGKIITLSNSRDLTAFAQMGYVKQSTKAFQVPLATIRELADAKRAWIRVSSPTGYIEDAIIDGTTDSKAYHALIRFLASVDQKQAPR